MIIPVISTILYVSLFGNDTNSGVSYSMALKNVQVAIEKAKVNDTVCIYPGIYREQINLEKTLTIVGYGSPIIQSSVLVTNWMQVSNNTWSTDWPVLPEIVMEAEDVPVTSLSWNDGKLYIQPRKPPTGIEIGNGTPFFAAYANKVKILGLRFRYSLSGYGGSGVSLGRFCRIENSEISWMGFQGLSCWNGEVINCTIRACGAKGLENAWTNAIIKGCIIGGHNWRGFSQAGQAAGVKLTTRYWDNPPDISGGAIMNSLFTSNNADAIWIDSTEANRPFIISENTITNNSGGIFIECSSGIHVTNNLIDANTNKAIVLRSSSRNLISQNISIVRYWASIDSIPLDMRYGEDGLRTSDNIVSNNKFTTGLKQAIISTGQDGIDPDSYYYNNIYTGNKFNGKNPQFNIRFAPSYTPVAFFNVKDFANFSNGQRINYGWRSVNPNTGNK